jgi:hypothetical protein
MEKASAKSAKTASLFIESLSTWRGGCHGLCKSTTVLRRLGCGARYAVSL